MLYVSTRSCRGDHDVASDGGSGLAIAAAPDRPRRTSTLVRVFATVALGCVVLIVTVAAIVLWRAHQHDVLSRTASYRYGESLLDYVETHPNGGVTPQQECDTALAARPGQFAGYSRTKARAGCLDEWTALNR
jgi:hypothetical protein